MKNLQLRKATIADDGFAYQTRKAAFCEYVEKISVWNEEEQRQLHQQRFTEHDVRVTQLSGIDVGIIAMSRQADCITLYQMFILPEYQDRGIGEKVKMLIIEEASKVKLPIRFQVLNVNNRAFAFYQRLGFKGTGENNSHILMERLSLSIYFRCIFQAPPNQRGDRMMRKIFLLMAAILLLGTVVSSSCTKDEPVHFGIYLADTGELVLSDHDIKAYRQTSSTIDTIGLTKRGIERWNTFQKYTGIPKLDKTLFGRDYVVKLEGEEMYRGKFYSGVSSASYAGVTILDSLFKLDNTHDTINIQFGYAAIFDPTIQDPRDNPAIISFFEKRGLLK